MRLSRKRRPPRDIQWLMRRDRELRIMMLTTEIKIRLGALGHKRTALHGVLAEMISQRFRVKVVRLEIGPRSPGVKAGVESTAADGAATDVGTAAEPAAADVWRRKAVFRQACANHQRS